jgi:hypothetical protein
MYNAQKVVKDMKLKYQPGEPWTTCSNGETRVTFRPYLWKNKQAPGLIKVLRI